MSKPSADLVEATTAIATAIAAAAKAGRWEEVERLRGDLRELRTLLDVANQSDTVATMPVSAAREKDAPPAKLPSLRDLATWLGCTHGFLSQCRSGTSRIRKSWADKIATVRPDLPATKKTWPKGWADED